MDNETFNRFHAKLKLGNIYVFDKIKHLRFAVKVMINASNNNVMFVSFAKPVEIFKDNTLLFFDKFRNHEYVRC